MNSKLISMLSLPILLSACAAPAPPSSPPSTSTTAATASGTGSSFASAIVVLATNERDGVAAEYHWLEKHCPGARSLGQSLAQHNNKPYDILHIQTKDGRKRDVYFDISKFFGKF